MNNKDLLFYKEYEDYYSMANNSEVFHRYCERVFGKDFSQDGFSDVTQINDIINLAGLRKDQVVLDIGCGNGKMLQYIHEKTGTNTYGFDYSKNAIAEAKLLESRESDVYHFETGLIGQMDYGENKFDLITSIDTIYFADDMSKFIRQVINWLKPNGYFICAYQEGDIKSKSGNEHTSEIAVILRHLGISYQVFDYSKRTYELLKHKRKVIESMKHEFLNNHLKTWYKCAIDQSIDADTSFDEFIIKNSRYLYLIQK